MGSHPAAELLRVERLTVRYGDRVALSDVDLVVPRGRSVAVIGPNGSGKSTLLAVIAGLTAPSTGTVLVDRSQVALVLQSTEVDPTLRITVQETIRMARYPHCGIFGRLGPADHASVRRSMERTFVADLARQPFHTLSGGQRQRVLVAQGLAQEADLLLLDEPVTGLDLVSREVINEVIDDERAAGRSVVLTTHSLEEAARCDVVVLVAGRVIAAGPPREVIVDEHLREAYGAQIMRLGSGLLILDDPHHHHDHAGH